MDKLTINYENAILKFNNSENIENYDNELLEFIEELDNLLILNDFIWLPNEIAKLSLDSEKIKKLMDKFKNFIEACTQKMTLFIRKKPTNQYVDLAFSDLLDILEFYINKINNNHWFKKTDKLIDAYSKHELKALNLYLFSSLDLIANIF